MKCRFCGTKITLTDKLFGKHICSEEIQSFVDRVDTYKKRLESQIATYSAYLYTQDSERKETAQKTLLPYITEDNDLESLSPYISWALIGDSLRLDGVFTADELEAMALWMRLHQKP